MKKLFILVLTVVVLFVGFVIYVNKDVLFNSDPTIEQCDHVFKDGKCSICGELEDKEDTGNNNGGNDNGNNDGGDVIPGEIKINLNTNSIYF